MESNNTLPKASRPRKLLKSLVKLLPLSFIILFFISVLLNILFLAKFKKSRTMVIKPQLEIQPQEVDAAAKVKNLMHLPQDEQPQVYTITSSTPRSQNFIADAKNGDILLIYVKNQKAILYDPLKNQILKVGPLTFATNSGELKK